MQNKALVKALNPSLHPFPSQETSEENRRSKRHMPGIYSSQEVQFRDCTSASS